MLTTKQKIVLARGANRVVKYLRAFSRQGMTGEFHRKGITWHLDLNEGIDFSIYCLGSFEPGTVRFYTKILRPGDVVFDIGANIGAHTLHFAKLVGAKGRVHAFEPTASAFQKLTRNLSLNPSLQQHVTLHHAFCSHAGEQTIPQDIYSSWPLSRQDNLHAKHLGALQPVGDPEVICLDQLAGALSLERLDLLKLDVDGNETKVLRGCNHILEHFHPKVLAEIAPYVIQENGCDMEDFWKPFRSNGYRMRTLDNPRDIPLETSFFERNFPRFSSVNVLLYYGHSHS